MPKHHFHIQSKESREIVINQFCVLISISAFISCGIYFFLETYLLSLLTGGIGAIFLFFVYLNKKGYYKFSRSAIVLITNAGVISFSLMLGFKSGIFTYLFVAPLLIYLMYDFKEKLRIIFVFLIFLCTFFIIYYYQEDKITPLIKLESASLGMINTYNYVATFIMTFGLVTYFAVNNNSHIENLMEQQATLEKEVELRVKSEKLLKKSLKERDVLLAEVHHRVKNNLAIISALLNLQMAKLKDDESKVVFEETRNRLFAISLIHNLLYSNRSLATIDFAEFIQKFCVNISDSYRSDINVEIEQHIEECEIDLKTATPLALILNELITNAFKHAFTDRNEGKISISLDKVEPKQLLFKVSDDGVGMDENFLTNGEMGMEIIQSLVEQLDGTLSYVKKNGSHFSIYIPVL